MAIIDAISIATQWVNAFGASLCAADSEAASFLIVPDGYLRDCLIFTWDCRTIQGRTKIDEFLSDKLSKHSFSNFQLDSRSPHLLATVDKSDASREVIKVFFTFETVPALCRGAVTLEELSGIEGKDRMWSALSVFTTVADWKGYEETPRMLKSQTDDRASIEELAGRRSAVETHPTVLIVGAGQAALQLAARLQQSGISCLIIEKDPRVGDNWRKRYPSLKLNVPRVYCQLLYQPFPSNYPAYIPKDLVADWLEAYALSQNLFVWTSSTVHDKPSYNSLTKSWTVTINRGDRHVRLHTKHLVMALSTFGDELMPLINGRETFSGSQVHSSHFPGGREYAHKRVLVMGAGNSASDICVDLVHGGADSVALFQRSPTCVHSNKYIHSLITSLFPEDIPIDVTDFKMEAMPVKLMLETLRTQQKLAREYDKDMLCGLKKAGFKLTDGPTGAGFIDLGLTKGGGYFFDSGFATLLCNSTIKLKTNVEITCMTERGIIFSDGSELEVDAIVYATGFRPIRETYKRILGDEIVDKTSDVWDLDNEGEIRGSCRPIGHPGLWYMAGDFSYARRSSKRLALLIRACKILIHGHDLPNVPFYSALHIIATPTSRAVVRNPVSIAVSGHHARSAPHLFSLGDEDGSVKIWSIQSDRVLAENELPETFEVHDRHEHSFRSATFTDSTGRFLTLPPPGGARRARPI